MGRSPAQWRGTPEAPWSRTDLTEGPKRPPSTGQSRPIAPRWPPPGTAGSQWCPPGWGHGGSPPSLSALAHLGSDSECQQGSGTRANVCALCTRVCTNECGVCARKLHVYMPGTPPFHRRPLPGRPGSRAGSSQPLGCCPDPKPRSAPSGAALTCAAGAFLVASEPHELLHWVLSSYRPGAEGVLRLGVGGALRPRPPSLCSSHTLVWPGCFTETNDMSFPLPVGTEGAPAPTGPGWPPLSPETLRDMAVTLAVLRNPRAFEGEPAWSGRPCSCPYPSACLGGDKGHCGVHVYVPGASPQLRGWALRPRGAGSKATSASVQDARLGQAPGSWELSPRCSPHGHPMAAPRRSLRGSVVGLDPRIPGGLGHGRLSRAGTRRLAWSRAHWSRPSQTSDVGPGRAKGRAWGFLSHGGGWGCSCDHFRNLPDELAGALDDMAPGAVGRWWPRARGAAGRAPVRGGARPAPTRPFPTGLSTLAPPLRLQQCGWPGAWGLGVWGGWGCLCMGYCWWGRLGPRQNPAPTPPGASCPLATSWPKEAAAGFLAHRPGQLGPAATPGGARCCLGLPAPGAHSLPVQGTCGGSSGRRAAEGPPGLTRTWAWSTCLGGAASSR